MSRSVLMLALGGALLVASLAHAAPEPEMNIVRGAVEKQFPAFVEDLGKLVNIDSKTGDAEGSDKIARLLATDIEALGGATEIRRNDKGSYLIGRFKGDGKLKILMLAHTDTVFAKGEAAKRPFRYDAQTGFAYGPGAGDDKAISVQMIHLMKILKELGIRSYGEIVLYYAAEEETGSAFNTQLIGELARSADVAFVMDTAKPDWGIVTKRKGMAKYAIKVEGVAGHAGTPYRGASAVNELLHQLAEVNKLASPPLDKPENLTAAALKARGIVDRGQFIPGNTINIAKIGTTNAVLNVVPDNANAEFEVRFYDAAEGQRIDREIRALAAKAIVPGTKVTITGSIETSPMEKTPQAQKVIDVYRGIVQRRFEGEIVEWSAGGLTDGNHSSPYCATIDSLGVTGYDVHTVREYADLKTFVPRTTALVFLIHELAAQGFGK